MERKMWQQESMTVKKQSNLTQDKLNDGARDKINEVGKFKLNYSLNTQSHTDRQRLAVSETTL